MLIYLIVTALTVLLAVLVRPEQNVCAVSGRYTRAVSRQSMLSGGCLLAIFILLFLPEALRINIGNDYARYVEFMHLIRANAYVPTEAGFNLFVWVVYAVCGYENYLLVFALFAAMTAGLFLAAIRRQAENFAFTFFLFMMFGYYFQSYNTVRYYFALALVVYALRFLLAREYLPFLAFVALGATFHKSVLVVLLLYPLALFAWKKWQLAVMLAFCTSFLLFQDFWLRVVVCLYPSYENTEYLTGSGLQYGNIARCGAVALLAILYYREAVQGSRTNRFYFYCNLGALALYTFCSFLPIISRIGYYLTVTQIFFLPAILRSIPPERKREKRFWTIVVIAAAILYFAVFLYKASAQNVKIVPYQSFLFTDMPSILSDVN
ncbi:MAG: EpsG family protein [Eubacteriales bacterium]|nr:EpsG family protein [Eubacteriales bacterium]